MTTIKRLSVVPTSDPSRVAAAGSVVLPNDPRTRRARDRS